MNENHYCIILAGGVGMRLWPASRQNKPKQFHDVLHTGDTLLQSTYRRFSQIISPKNIIVVTNEQYANLVYEQLPSLSSSNLLLEPIRRNNLSAALWATLEVRKRNPKASMILSPCDQSIKDEHTFCNDISHALNYCYTTSRPLVIGATPTSVKTEYGYIQMADHIVNDIYKVRTFTEKPEKEFAQMFVESGEFLWNTGLFVWDANSFLKAMLKALAEQSDLISDISTRYQTGNNLTQVINDIFSKLPSLTIEQGVIEKFEEVDVMLCHFGWHDIGTWKSVYDAHEKTDSNNNVVLETKSLLYDCENCIVKLPNGHVAVLQGLKDYIVVEEGNVLIVCKKDEKSIRKYVNDAMINLGEEYT